MLDVVIIVHTASTRKSNNLPSAHGSLASAENIERRRARVLGRNLGTLKAECIYHGTENRPNPQSRRIPKDIGFLLASLFIAAFASRGQSMVWAVVSLSPPPSACRSSHCSSGFAMDTYLQAMSRRGSSRRLLHHRKRSKRVAPVNRSCETVKNK